MNNIFFYNSTEKKTQDLLFFLLEKKYKVYTIVHDLDICRSYNEKINLPFGWFTTAYADPSEPIRAPFLVLDAMDLFASFEFSLYVITSLQELTNAQKIYERILPYMKEQKRGVQTFFIHSSLKKDLEMFINNSQMPQNVKCTIHSFENTHEISTDALSTMFSDL